MGVVFDISVLILDLMLTLVGSSKKEAGWNVHCWVANG